jgi:TrmH family RNA methyltransferase
VLTDSHRDRLCVVLVRTRNPLNLGTAARAMSNFGFGGLRVVQPYELAFREVRSAVGASDLLKLAKEYKSVAAAVSDCALVIGTTAIGQRQRQHPVRTLAAGAKLIRARLGSQRVALLFGSEKTGLSNQDLSHCHWLLHIPTQPRHLSMNLGQAVAVTLYELARAGRAEKSSPRVHPASANDLERLTQLLLEAATVSGFIDERTSPSSEQKLRRLIRRLQVESEDAPTLLGIVRQILWKLRAVTEHRPSS